MPHGIANLTAPIHMPKGIDNLIVTMQDLVATQLKIGHMHVYVQD